MRSPGQTQEMIYGPIFALALERRNIRVVSRALLNSGVTLVHFRRDKPFIFQSKSEFSTLECDFLRVTIVSEHKVVGWRRSRD